VDSVIVVDFGVRLRRIDCLPLSDMLFCVFCILVGVCFVRAVCYVHILFLCCCVLFVKSCVVWWLQIWPWFKTCKGCLAVNPLDL